MFTSIEIRLEIETTLSSGERAVWTTTTLYNGDIVNWSEEDQLKSIRRTWRAMKKQKGDRLVAFQLPVKRWKRIAVTT